VDKVPFFIHQTRVNTARIVILAALLGPIAAPAAETRIWTSRKGSNIEAEMLKVEEDTVVLVNKDAKQIQVKFRDLSLADRQYLVEYGGADKKILVGEELGEPEKDVRIDSKTFNKLDKQLQLGDESILMFELLETEHFLVGYAGKVRPNGVAETAERLWHGMAFQHMNFRRDWGDKRRLVLLCEDREVYAALGKWYSRQLAEGGNIDAAQKSQVLWDKVGATTVSATDKLAEEWNLHRGVTVYNIKEGSEKRYRDDLSPFPTHVLAGHLLRQQMGGVSNYGSEGYFAVITGHAYFKEIQLAGKTETNLIDASGSQFDEITSSRGFEDGTSWARTLRSLVRRDKLTPDFEKMLAWDQGQLDPEKLVLIYSFAYFCQSTPERLAGFAALVRLVESSNQIPEPLEFAKLFGFETPDEFEAAWIEFIKSTQFK
jgi:hypothetical protein